MPEGSAFEVLKEFQQAPSTKQKADVTGLNYSCTVAKYLKNTRGTTGEKRHRFKHIYGEKLKTTSRPSVGSMGIVVQSFHCNYAIIEKKRKENPQNQIHLYVLKRESVHN